MKVISLFDGISCGQVALNRAGIKVDQYVAFEIEASAIKITQANFPDTVQGGDVTKAGIVLGSDGFFPFGDSVAMAARFGVSAIVQPGGSVRDQESIDEADRNGIAMLFTGMRHFKH